MARALTIPELAVLIVAAAACITDFRSRRIPNALTFGAAGAALAYAAISGGLAGVGGAIAGWAVGCAFFLPWFLLGGMGAGDVKLLAALGAWLGPGPAVWMALYGGIAGGGFAIIVSLIRGYMRQSMYNLWSLLMFWRVAGIQPLPNLTLRTAAGPRLPYAFPIAVGAVAVIWLR
jgi:prepilin peptidase CpaA